MSIRSKLAALRRMPRVDLYGPRSPEQFDPHSERHWTKRFLYGGSQEWGERWGPRQSFPPIGSHIRKLPFYLAVPSEPYNADLMHRRGMMRISLLDLQRLVDMGRLDPDAPVDLTNIANTGLYRLKPGQYGFQLTDDGMDNFAVKFTCLEVQHASEAAIAAVECRGGRIVTRFYDLISVSAKADARAFFATGQPIPVGKLPPVSAIDYYSAAENRGYLAKPEDIARCRLELAQKYGYPTPAPLSAAPAEDDYKDAVADKSPRQIFAGLEPGWVVSLADELVYKPKSPDVLDYYQRPV